MGKKSEEMLTPAPPIMSGSSGMMGGAGVSISSDFLPLGSSTRSRMLELNVEYRDRMIRLKVQDHESIQTVTPATEEDPGSSADTNDELSLLQISLPTTHTLTVAQVVRHDRPSGSSQRPIVLDDTANSDVEISDDDYQDAPEPMDDDDFLLAQPSRSGIQPLLPDDFGDEALAEIKFGEEFGNRY